MAPVSILGLSGSLRSASYSTAVLQTLAERVGWDISLRIYDYSDVPLYNQDLDGPLAPASVSAFRRAIADADGLLIATPEYNYGIPGVLKNALDWASRPHGAGSLLGKPVSTLSVSPALTGGVRALAQLHETLLATQSLLVPQAQTVITEVHKKLHDGKLTHDETVNFALKSIDGLRAMISRSAQLAA